MNDIKGKLSVVVASYNQPAYLKQTIESIVEQTYHPFELIIVDNSSTNPETLHYIQQLSFPGNERIQLKKLTTAPSGRVTRTWNAGIRAATGEYVAILNNDITFSKHWDMSLITALDDSEVWLANPYQTDDGESTPYERNTKAGDFNIRGACFMFRKNLVKTTGYLPDQLKIWFQDAWLAWTITQKYGKRSVFVPQSVIYHAGSKSLMDFDEKTKLLWYIIRGDAYYYHILTRENIDKYLELCEARTEK